MVVTSTAQGVPATICRDILLKVADSLAERENAFRLIYHSYLNSGLCAPNPYRIRITPYQLVSSTDVFVAKLRDDVVATLSLARDGGLGLPMEKIYPEEIAERRAAGLRLAEVTCLADRRNRVDRFFGLFCELGRLMVQSATLQRIDQLLIAVHPRHAALYRRYMAFRRIGVKRSYAAVCGNPAVALCLDLNEIQVNPPASFSTFFGSRIPAELLQPRPMSAVERSHFMHLMSLAMLQEEAHRHSNQNDHPEAAAAEHPNSARDLCAIN